MPLVHCRSPHAPSKRNTGSHIAKLETLSPKMSKQQTANRPFNDTFVLVAISLSSPLILLQRRGHVLHRFRFKASYAFGPELIEPRPVAGTQVGSRLRSLMHKNPMICMTPPGTRAPARSYSASPLVQPTCGPAVGTPCRISGTTARPRVLRDM